MRTVLTILGVLLATAGWCQPRLRMMTGIGHTDSLSSAVFSPDGKSVLTASLDGTARLWDVVTGKEIRRFEGHGDVVRSAMFSADGKSVLTTSWDNTARLWDVATGKEMRRFEGHESGVSSAIFSPDGKTVLTASWDKTARLWDVATGKEMRRFEGHGDMVRSAIFSPDGKTVLTASLDGTARLWDVATGKETRRLEGHENRAVSAVFSPNGKSVLTAGFDKTARLWDLATGKETLRFEGHADMVRSAVFSPNGKSVLTAGDDKTARLWDVARGQETRRFEGHRDMVRSAVFSADGKSVLTESADQTARLWDEGTGQETRKFEGDGVSNAILAADGKSILTVGFDSTTRLWDVATGKETRRFEGHGSKIASAIYSWDGKSVLTASLDSTARLWDVAIGQETRRFEGHGSWLLSAIFSADGKSVLTASNDKTARLWDVATGRETRRFEGHGNWVTSAIFSADGKRVLTASGDRTARLWDVATGKETRRFASDGSPLLSALFSPELCATFSPDSDNVLTSGDGSSARLWDVVTGKETRRFEHRATVTSATFSADGKSVLTASADKTARLWDVVTGKEIRRFEGHGDVVRSAMFSADGKSVLTTSWDNTARLWDVATGKEMRRFEGHGSTVMSALFSSDGRSVLTASGDKTARLWDVATGKETHRFEGHRATVSSAVLSADGKSVLTASEDGTSRIWDTETGKELCALISYRDGSWAVVDPQGRYDSSDNGRNQNLYWVFEDPAKNILEPIDIEQFSSQFYTPGLLARVMRREELPPVPDLKNPPLFPRVNDVRLNGRTVEYGLTARGGGIGTTRVLVDGQEVAQVQGKEGKNEVTLPVTIKPGAKVEVVAFNENDSLSSPRAGSTSTNPPPLDMSTPTRYVAVISGVNNYQGSLPKLNFAVADATAMVKSVQALAKGLNLVPDIYLLTNDPGAKALSGVTVLPSTPASFEQLLTKTIPAKGAWRPSDMLFLYLAGHGTVYGDKGRNHYAYLTQDATSADMGLPEVRAQQAVTDDDLVKWLAYFLGGKKALVLDTCAAGTAMDVIKEGMRSQDPDLDRQQAVYETQRRVGFKVLFGCAENQVSYEAPEYGHGVLTWSLLNSLANDPLGTQENKNMIYVSNLFNAAESTTKRETGKQIAQQYGTRENFPLGFLDDGGRKAIPFTSKVPLIGKISLLENGLDPLDLEQRLSDAIGGLSRGGIRAALALTSPDSKRAYRLSGQYSVAGDAVDVQLNLVAPDGKVESVKVKGQKASIIETIVNALLEWAKGK